ncbi:MAG: hypothetical protein PUF49_09855 [Firmicutes bacterium]|nr:hypothetical protein [Bacillota bacterium]
MSDKRYRITLTRKQLDLICHSVDRMLCVAALNGKNKSDDELEYETIYSAIQNFENARYAYVRGYCFPMQSGNEPIPKIERVEE